MDYDELPSLPMTFRVGVYHCADVLLHPPINEGLNLLPLEYVFCRMEWLLMEVSALSCACCYNGRLHGLGDRVDVHLSGVSFCSINAARSAPLPLPPVACVMLNPSP